MRNQKQLVELFSSLACWMPNIEKIRIGDCGDGGYVLPNDLTDIEGVISIGIGNNASFDDFFLQRNCRVHQYDGTIPASPSSQGLFIKKNLGARDGDQTVSLATMVKNMGGDQTKDLILKFDIEGAEWEALEDAP